MISDGIWTAETLELIREHLRDRECWRCKVRYRDHAGADHLWFEYPEDAPDHENN